MYGLPLRANLKKGKAGGEVAFSEAVMRIRTSETESLQDAIQPPVLTVHAEEAAQDFSAGKLSNSLSKGA